MPLFAARQWALLLASLVLGGAAASDAQAQSARTRDAAGLSDEAGTAGEGRARTPKARRADTREVERRIEAPPMKVGAPADADKPAAKVGTIERLTGVWVEGPGFDVKYGDSYERCAERCIAHQKCVMIEYYRPERKCNLYSSMRPRLKGGSSFVGIKG